MPPSVKRRSQSGFTLLEMLVVVSIIAAVAGIGTLALNGVTQDAREQLVRVEMANIAKAIQRFRADTGYWPKEGPFAADDSDNGNARSTASLSQLKFAPFDDLDDDLNTTGDQELILPYDIASGTGWNGPYIRELDAGTVTVRNGANLVAVRGLGDPFDAAPNGAEFVWNDTRGVQIAHLGRPYRYFIDPGAVGVVAGCQVPCLLSYGPDGEYDTGNDDDIVVNIAGN